MHKKLPPHDYGQLQRVSTKLAQMVQICCSEEPQMRPSMAVLNYFLWPEVKKDIEKVLCLFSRFAVVCPGERHCVT